MTSHSVGAIEVSGVGSIPEDSPAGMPNAGGRAADDAVFFASLAAMAVGGEGAGAVEAQSGDPAHSERSPHHRCVNIPHPGEGISSEIGGGPSFPPPLASSQAAGRVRGLAMGQVARVVGGALPAGVHLSRGARVAFQKAATTAVLFLGCLADEERRARQKGKARKMLNAQDVRGAMTAAGLAYLIPLMQTPIKRNRE